MDDLTRKVIEEIKRRDPGHFGGTDPNTPERISPNVDHLENWRDLPLATILVDALEGRRPA